MSTLDTLVVKLEADSSSYSSTLDAAENKAKVWGGKMGGILQGAAMGLGLGMVNMATKAIGGAFDMVGGSIDAASNLGETISKVGVIFGDSSKDINSWAKTASKRFGQSEQQALDAASTFATFGKAAGLSGSDLNDMSTKLTELASDMASFSNTTPEDAINAIGSALRGEAEPMRAYGVLLDDASMRQKALELGLIATTKEALTPQNKVLAAQALIFAQTSAAQGDFARTSEGLANKTRTFQASMEELKTVLGTAFLPIAEKAMSWAADMVQKVLPPLAAFITEKVLPAVTGFTDALSEWVNTYGSKISGWVSSALASIASFVAGFGGARNDVTTYADDIGRLTSENLVKAGDSFSNMLETLSKFTGWFDSGEAKKPRNWFGYLVWAMGDTLRVLAEMGDAMITLLAGIARNFEGWATHNAAMMAEGAAMVHDAWSREITGGTYNWDAATAAPGINYDNGGYQGGGSYGSSASSITVHVSADSYNTGRAVGAGVMDELRAQGMA